MAKKKTIDIGSLSEEQQKAIQAQLKAVDNAAEKAAADNAAEKAEVERAKEAVECYYHLKAEIETILMEKLWPEGGKKNTPLSKSRLAEIAKNKTWSLSKILKVISILPNKKPETDNGFVVAARNIEVGKTTRKRTAMLTR